MANTMERNRSFIANGAPREHGFRGGVCRWMVPINGIPHQLVLKHGGITGRVILKDNEQVILRKRAKMKLVGHVDFAMDGYPCHVHIEPIGRFSFRYWLYINGHLLEEFLSSSENQKL
eukprot:TRINITY_DN5391_c1_g1_i1.p3 TRINITY_DN5391_c1_g1~~TRINITY_DN5391_c1_g1_i1.p3  ORF type:complete len:118 (+),score=24.92 TRINITY_DN5391_c1_g1_i1:1730-2083(+)